VTTGIASAGKKPVAEAFRAGGTFFLRTLMIAAEAHAAKTGDQRQDDHHPADAIFTVRLSPTS
jgi:hypothetical protein